jgi:hypothetical protein
MGDETVLVHRLAGLASQVLLEIGERAVGTEHEQH